MSAPRGVFWGQGIQDVLISLNFTRAAPTGSEFNHFGAPSPSKPDPGHSDATQRGKRCCQPRCQTITQKKAKEKGNGTMTCQGHTVGNHARHPSRHLLVLF